MYITDPFGMRCPSCGEPLQLCPELEGGGHANQHDIMLWFLLDWVAWECPACDSTVKPSHCILIRPLVKESFNFCVIV